MQTYNGCGDPSAREFFVDQSTITTFENAANDFARFAERQGFPARLLWITSEDIVF